jgi:MFS family permease
MCAICGIATHVPDTAEPASAPVDRTRFAALRNPSSRNYIVGASMSMGGDSIEHVISYWVMYQQFHSPALAGFAVISHWVPALFSVYFGAWADRSDCRKIIQLAQVLYMAVSATWGVLFLTNSLQVWHCLVLLSVHGLAGAIWAPAEQLMLHDLAGRETLPSAVRLNSTGRSTGFLAGPALGSVMLLVLGPSLAIFANVLVYLPMTIWLMRTPYTGHVRDAAAPSRVSPADAMKILREVTGQPVLISMVLLGGISSFLIGSGIQPQMPEFAVDLGLNQAGIGYGLLLAANSAGAVLGGVILESTHWLKPTVRAAMISTLVWAGCFLGFAIAQQYVVALLLLVGAGVANLSAQATAQTLVQLLAPAEKRGRIVGVYAMASNGLRAGSGLSIGLLGGAIGIHWSLALSAIVLATLVMWLMWNTERAAAATRPAIAQRYA